MIFNNNDPHVAKHTHKASDVGLGNVPNVATNDQTPTFTQASTLTNIASGEKMNVIMGKVMKGMADLISHLANKSNPHGVTAAQAGAYATTDSRTANTVLAAPNGSAGAATFRKLVAADIPSLAASKITSGTFAVGRGGTGKASWAANRLIYPSAATTLAQLAFPTTAGSVLRQGTSGAPYWTPLADLMTAMGGARVQIGSYTGTGTYGPSNPNKVALPFSPKLFILMVATEAKYIESLTNRIWAQNEWVAFYPYNGSFYKFCATDGGSSSHFAKNMVITSMTSGVSWYGTYNDVASNDSEAQANISGTVYLYIGIG